ncbi:hypothetical protein Trydic_g21683 [Trypoxylus dichotomus]
MQPSAEKVMLSIFWDIENGILVDFLQKRPKLQGVGHTTIVGILNFRPIASRDLGCSRRSQGTENAGRDSFSNGVGKVSAAQEFYVWEYYIHAVIV